MKDRIVQYPNRFKLTQVSGDIYDITPNPGIVTEEGTPLNKAALLSDAAARSVLLNPADNPTVSDAIINAGRMGKWVLLQSYTTPGTFTWTAPDYYRDGSPYEIGGFIVGGGGSGGAARYYVGQNVSSVASGGASGRTKAVTMTVTPGNSYSVVVGAGGAAVTVSEDTYAHGNAGGSSSFASNTAAGGAGGRGAVGTYSIYASGGTGGQGSDGVSSSSIRTIAPAMGEEASNSLSAAGGKSHILEATNPFTMRRVLGAGGGASSSTNGLYLQTCPVCENGAQGGAANGYYGGRPATTATGGTKGCGGGGCAVATILNDWTSASTTKSGKGGDGYVEIYVRGLA